MPGYIHRHFNCFFIAFKNFSPENENQSNLFNLLLKTDRRINHEAILIDLINLFYGENEVGCIDLFYKLTLLPVYSRAL